MKVIFAIFLFFAYSESYGAEELRIISAGPNSVSYFKENKQKIEALTQSTLLVSMNPAAAGIVGVQKDLFDVFVGPSIEETFESALKEKGVKLNPDDYQAEVFNTRTAKIGVHPSNPVKSLDDAQITGILTGSITSWEPITGEKKPLALVVTENYTGSMKTMANTYLKGGLKLGPQKKVLDRDGALRAMKADPGALSVFMQEIKSGEFIPRMIETKADYSNYIIFKKPTKGGLKPSIQSLIKFIKENRPKGA